MLLGTVDHRLHLTLAVFAVTGGRRLLEVGTGAGHHRDLLVVGHVGRLLVLLALILRELLLLLLKVGQRVKSRLAFICTYIPVFHDQLRWLHLRGEVGSHRAYSDRLLGLAALRVPQIHVVEALLLRELRALEAGAHVDRCDFCFNRCKASSSNLLTAGLFLNLPSHLRRWSATLTTDACSPHARALGRQADILLRGCGPDVGPERRYHLFHWFLNPLVSQNYVSRDILRSFRTALQTAVALHRKQFILLLLDVHSLSLLLLL